MLRVLSDILNAVEYGDVAALVPLDLKAAFYAVDHDILLLRLRVTFGINDVIHRCMDTVVPLWPDAACTPWTYITSHPLV